MVEMCDKKLQELDADGSLESTRIYKQNLVKVGFAHADKHLEIYRIALKTFLNDKISQNNLVESLRDVISMVHKSN